MNNNMKSTIAAIATTLALTLGCGAPSKPVTTNIQGAWVYTVTPTSGEGDVVTGTATMVSSVCATVNQNIAVVPIVGPACFDYVYTGNLGQQDELLVGAAVNPVKNGGLVNVMFTLYGGSFLYKGTAGAPMQNGTITGSYACYTDGGSCDAASNQTGTFSAVKQ
jgi:hypothetical protein